jgi:hypothetical protein
LALFVSARSFFCRFFSAMAAETCQRRATRPDHTAPVGAWSSGDRRSGANLVLLFCSPLPGSRIA